MNSNCKSVIVGFDLGHGEFALSKCIYNQRDQQVQEKEELEKTQNEEKIKKGEYLKILTIHGKQSQITAINYEDGIKTIGDGAWENTKDTNKVTKLEICFKQKPSSESFCKDTIKDFVNTVYYSLIKGNNQEKPQLLENENNYFFIGYPSGWYSKEGKEYQEVIVKSNLSNVKVVPESRAAFMHAEESRTTFNTEDLRKSVLVIDCGSSTIDYTAVKLDDKGYYAKPIDFGYDLGASLIEQAIFKITIQNHEKKDFIHNLFNQHPHLKRRFEITCRKAKEEYFKALEDQKVNPENYQNNSNLETSVFCRIEDEMELNEELTPLVNKQIINKILHNIRLSDLLDECRINGKFIETFKKQLKESKTRLEKYGYNPSAIFLTGGASRMYFVAEECQKVFENAKIIQDLYPEVSIAKGLTRWGHVYRRKEQVKSEIDNFINNDLSSIIKSKIDNLLNDIAETLASSLVNEVVKPRIIAWKNCKIKTIADLEQDLKQKTEHFFSKEYSQKHEKPVIDWLTLLQKDINQEIKLILREYNFNKDGYLAEKLATDLFDIDFLKINIPEILFEKIFFIIIKASSVNKILTRIFSLIISIPLLIIQVILLMAAGGFFYFPLSTATLISMAVIMEIGVFTFNKFKIKLPIIENIKHRDFSQWQRNILNEKKINKICEKSQLYIIKEIREQFKKNKQEIKEEIFELTTKEFQDYIEKILNNILNESWWIVS